MFTVSYFYRFPVWPTYDLFHVLHCNLCIPLDFILFCGAVSHNCLYIKLHVRKAMFKSVLLSKLVTVYEWTVIRNVERFYFIVKRQIL
jgi:hypothetical protein